MIIVLRGHIRNSFDDSQIYNFISYLSNNYNIEIYIHTWSIKQNNISWRQIKNDFTEINEEYIYNYFKDLSKYIKKIIIDDENKIELTGNLTGKILLTKTNILGWKRYIYGQYVIFNYLYNLFKNKYLLILNTRFDLFTNLFVFHVDEINNFIKSNINKTFTKNIFIKDYEVCGIDNIIIGNIKTNYELFSFINFNLDKILLYKENEQLVHPEFIVLRVNNLLFNF